MSAEKPLNLKHDWHISLTSSKSIAFHTTEHGLFQSSNTTLSNYRVLAILRPNSRAWLFAIKLEWAFLRAIICTPKKESFVIPCHTTKPYLLQFFIPNRIYVNLHHGRCWRDPSKSSYLVRVCKLVNQIVMRIIGNSSFRSWRYNS